MLCTLVTIRPGLVHHGIVPHLCTSKQTFTTPIPQRSSITSTAATPFPSPQTQHHHHNHSSPTKSTTILPQPEGPQDPSIPTNQPYLLRLHQARARKLWDGRLERSGIWTRDSEGGKTAGGGGFGDLVGRRTKMEKVKV